MTPALLYVTGTNTGVGKTTLCAQLLRRARDRGLVVGAMKPFCSGGRADAEALHALQTAGMTLDEVNPFYFAEPVSPYVAAREENRRITETKAVKAIDQALAKNIPLVVEGAGGVLSPLGDRFTLLDIIRQCPAKTCVVGMNILGVINAALLTYHALQATSADVRFVLMSPAETDASTVANADVIREWTGLPVFEFPFLHSSNEPNLRATAVIDSLLDWWMARE